jgi:hypothetical protein
MQFWISLLINLLYIGTYVFFYHFLGFELTVILILSQIMSNLVQRDRKKVTKTRQTLYVPQKRKIRL